MHTRSTGSSARVCCYYIGRSGGPAPPFWRGHSPSNAGHGISPISLIPVDGSAGDPQWPLCHGTAHLRGLCGQRAPEGVPTLWVSESASFPLWGQWMSYTSCGGSAALCCGVGHNYEVLFFSYCLWQAAIRTQQLEAALALAAKEAERQQVRAVSCFPVSRA